MSEATPSSPAAPEPALQRQRASQLLQALREELQKAVIGQQAVIDDLLIRYVEALIYQSVAENMASEQSARMVAMKAATDNAGNVIKELQLVYNKARQAAITKEISEIVGGAAAIAG